MGRLTKKYLLRGRNGGLNMFTSALSKSFIRDKLNLSFMHSIPLVGKMYIKQYSHGADFENRMNTTIPAQHVALTLTRNSGNTRKQLQTRKGNISSNFQGEKSDQQMSGVRIGAGVGM